MSRAERFVRHDEARDNARGAPWRWPVDLPATVQEHRSCAFDVRIVDLSLTGCRLWAGFRLKPGRPAQIAIEGFAPFDATIVWSENWYAALRFRHPLHLAVLHHLVSGHPVPSIHSLPGDPIAVSPGASA